jgi:hypothetical protein
MESQAFQTELVVRTPLINEHLETQAGRYAYWASLSAEASRNARNAKLHAEVVEAQVTREAKSQLEQLGESPSEWKVMAMMKGDPRRIAAWEHYNEQQYQADVLFAAKDGFAQRKDLLVTIAANLRGEMGGQVRVSKQPQRMRYSEPEVEEEDVTPAVQTPVRTSNVPTPESEPFPGERLGGLSERFRQMYPQ